MAFSSLRPAIFFDRDGTLIEDNGHLRFPEEAVFYQDTLPALLKLKDHYLLFIVTNQPGISLGILRHEEVEKVNQSIVEVLAHKGIKISAVYYCPHRRDEECECIKPNPYFLLRSAQEFKLDLSRSFVVGDHPHDVKFAHKVGAQGIYLLTGHGAKHLEELPPDTPVANNMQEVAEWIMKRSASNPNKFETIHKASEIIKQGGIVAFPTETVYGLGADAFNPLAVARVFEVKKRPYFDPLIVHIAIHKDMDRLVTEIPSNAKKLIERFWPGPLTLVLLKKEDIPDIVTSGLPTLAVRMPNHPMTLKLIKLAGCPIVGPSANPFGYLSPTTAEHVRDQLGDQIDFILDGGPCEVGVESTIISFVGKIPKLLRPGGVSLEVIESIIGGVEIDLNVEERPAAPGMLPKHYAPRTPIVLNWNEQDLDSYREKKVGFLAFQKARNNFKFHHVEVLSEKGDLREAAANLFAAIHRLDALNLDFILVEAVPEDGLGRAIMDRLRRASTMISVNGDSPSSFRGKGKKLYTTEDLLNDRRKERREEDEKKG